MAGSVTAHVRFRLPSGSVELRPGDLIGRSASAALVIDDPRVSEAHAMVSLRRGELYLLSLRRLVVVRGRAVSEVVLQAGETIELAPGLSLEVLEVAQPAQVAALRSRVLGLRPLGQVASIVTGPPLRIVGRFLPDAAAHLWTIGKGEWRLRIGDGKPKVLALGDAFTVGGVELSLCEIDLATAGREPTQAGGHEAPLRIVAHYDGVELHRTNRPVVTIGGIGARIISELVAFGGPVDWEVAAREIWRDETNPLDLRRRWDVALSRLRARLREAGIRADLLRSDGVGQLQLVLGEGDQVHDRT